MNYLDTSALVKRFVSEPGSDVVQRLMGTEGPAVTATIAYAEVYSGLTRKRRAGDITERSYALACRRFEEDWRAMIRVELTADVLTLARKLILKHPLRGFDAIHLASAMSLRAELGQPVTFAAADARLLVAAHAERMPVVDVEAPPQE